MPQSVLHILVPLILAALFKDWYDSRKGKNGRKFSLHYVLVAGIAGLIPDVDIAIFWVLHFFGFTLNEVHRTFTHTLFVPLIFVALFFVFRNVKIKQVRKYEIKSSVVFLMIAFGSFVHLILDAIFSGQIAPFYPLSVFALGLNLVGYFPEPLRDLFIPSLEAALLVIWLIYLELKRKVRDFV